MNTHVFIVNEQTFKYHLEYMFAGTGAKDKASSFLCDASCQYNAHSERNLVGMIADISRIQIGDNIIFYLQSASGKQGQFFGIFQAKSIAFFDENDDDNYLKNEMEKGLSYRILIEPSSQYGVYPEGVTEHEYLDSLDGKNKPYELCWSLIYRKLKGNRGCTMITDFEFEDLLSKFENKCEHLSNLENYTYDSGLNKITACTNFQEYDGRKNLLLIKDRMLFKANKGNAFETHLQAYIMQNINSLNLLKFPERNFWVGNEVSCGVGMQRIDVLLIQKDDEKVYIKIIELKDEVPTEDIVDSQLQWYIKWLFDYIVPNYSDKQVEITPCVVAAKTDNQELIQHIRNKEFSNPYMYSIIQPAEYHAFSISENNIVFERII